MNLFLIILIFCWDPSPDATGYKFYQDNVFIGATTDTRYTVNDLDWRETYDFYVTATRDGLESDPSNHLTFHAPRMKMMARGSFSFTRPIARSNQDFVIESSKDLKNWIVETDVTEGVLPLDDLIETVVVNHNSPEPHLFYRIKIVNRAIGCAATN